jgi:hypothetical protein
MGRLSARQPLLAAAGWQRPAKTPLPGVVARHAGAKPWEPRSAVAAAAHWAGRQSPAAAQGMGPAAAAVEARAAASHAEACFIHTTHGLSMRLVSSYCTGSLLAWALPAARLDCGLGACQTASRQCHVRPPQDGPRLAYLCRLAPRPSAACGPAPQAAEDIASVTMTSSSD